MSSALENIEHRIMAKLEEYDDQVRQQDACSKMPCARVRSMLSIITLPADVSEFGISALLGSNSQLASIYTRAHARAHHWGAWEASPRY